MYQLLITLFASGIFFSELSCLSVAPDKSCGSFLYINNTVSTPMMEKLENSPDQ